MTTSEPTPTRDEAVLSAAEIERIIDAYVRVRGVDAVALREICEDMLDMHHGRQASMDVDAPSFGRGAAAGWDAAVSAFYKAAVARINRATDAEIGGIHRSFASAPAPASGGVDAVARLIWNRWHARHGGDYDGAKGTLARADTEGLAKQIIASLSPAATPVSEAGGAAFRVTKRGAFVQHEPLLPAFDLPDGTYDLHLAKPASSPAGGDVVRCLATGNPVGTDTWQVGRPCRCANCLPLSQSTSAGRVGE